MKIKELSEKTEVSVRTIRYYTQKGLLPEVEKVGNYKDYPEEMVERILFIKEAQKIFIPLDKIKEMLDNGENLPNNIKINNQIHEVETIKINSAMIYTLSDDIEIISKNGRKISQEKLNKIKEIIK